MNSEYNKIRLIDNEENKGRYASFCINYNKIKNCDRGCLCDANGNVINHFMKFHLHSGTYIMKIGTINELEQFYSRLLHNKHDEHILNYTVGYTDAKL